MIKDLREKCVKYGESPLFYSVGGKLRVMQAAKDRYTAEQLEWIEAFSNED